MIVNNVYHIAAAALKQAADDAKKLSGTESLLARAWLIHTPTAEACMVERGLDVEIVRERLIREWRNKRSVINTVDVGLWSKE